MMNNAFEGSRASVVKSLMTIFFVACVVGWLYETILEVVIYKTGFITGIIKIIYKKFYKYDAEIISSSCGNTHEKNKN